MEHYTIRYFDDPLSANPTELGSETEPTYAKALDRVSEVMPGIRAKHGVRSGYRIEDGAGRTVFTGPGGANNT